MTGMTLETALDPRVTRFLTLLQWKPKYPEVCDWCKQRTLVWLWPVSHTLRCSKCAPPDDLAPHANYRCDLCLRAESSYFFTNPSYHGSFYYLPSECYGPNDGAQIHVAHWICLKDVFRYPYLDAAVVAIT